MARQIAGKSECTDGAVGLQAESYVSLLSACVVVGIWFEGCGRRVRLANGSPFVERSPLNLFM
ncbi:hypothetical protein LC605_23985 [Nostoc sp. CHAB 5836]|uniref:hypothetical protein n=1 Tax=Nostoc sp. CHAB 5836 TaxID=2780404 RepID=UPI001E4518DE|nr:hypothetical protein [Nostoc sp. CHAB 5836]MCC5618088.1 hypothetical protein [Nostoc sp. CHAB 5836]